MVAMLDSAREDAVAGPYVPRVNAVPRVLVIDDEETKRAQLSNALAIAGFEAHGTSSANAPHEIAAGEFDVAIIDLMLHGTNGFDLARRMRSANPGLRVVLTSAYHFTEVQLARIDCGAVGFVPQPFAIEELTSFLWSKLGA
jgi:DNA-binding response OmpR family regulator